jgi:hypothetical protein
MQRGWLGHSQFAGRRVGAAQLHRSISEAGLSSGAGARAVSHSDNVDWHAVGCGENVGCHTVSRGKNAG